MSGRPAAADGGDHCGMQFIAGGQFLMGSDEFYEEERPVRLAEVGDFWIDIHPVTNRKFAQFVAATGYRTFAEFPPDPEIYLSLPPEMMFAGSAVFTPPDGGRSPAGPMSWWQYLAGASWRQPLGLNSSIEDILDHPVVQIAYVDAEAYALWAGKSLPTEAEWEFAARGGLSGAVYAWGDELAPQGRPMANYWQGEFPSQNTLEDGYERTSPVGAFPANAFGLYDMIGNVWEWTEDWFTLETADPRRSCCGPPRARRGTLGESLDSAASGAAIPRKVLKGGSHLCAANYCQRYRPAARYAHHVDSPTSHVGFRCVARP